MLQVCDHLCFVHSSLICSRDVLEFGVEHPEDGSGAGMPYGLASGKDGMSGKGCKGFDSFKGPRLRSLKEMTNVSDRTQMI